MVESSTRSLRSLQIVFIFSIVLTFLHAIILLKSPASIITNIAFYIGTAFSIAFIGWVFSTQHADFFSTAGARDGGTKTHSMPSSVNAQREVVITASETSSRYQNALAVTILSETILLFDLSLAWYRGIQYAWSLLTVATKRGSTSVWPERLVFPLCVLWMTFVWGIGNLVGVMALGHLAAIGREAGVERMTIWTPMERVRARREKVE